MLPSLATARWFHACSLTTRFNINKYMVVIGGVTTTDGVINTIEYYNLASKPSTWTTDGKYHVFKQSHFIAYDVSRQADTSRQAADAVWYLRESKRNNRKVFTDFI